MLEFMPTPNNTLIMTDQHALLQTERRWTNAHLTLNLAEIQDILDDDYKRIDGDHVLNKAHVIASYASGQRHWDVAEGRNYSIHIYENFATVVGTWRGVGVNHGNAFDYEAQFLAVYIKRAGSWKLYRDEIFE